MSTAVASFITSAAVALVEQWEKEFTQKLYEANQETSISIITDTED